MPRGRSASSNFLHRDGVDDADIELEDFRLSTEDFRLGALFVALDSRELTFPMSLVEIMIHEKDGLCFLPKNSHSGVLNIV